MGKSRFTEEQIQNILAEYRPGTVSVDDVCRKYGISGATLYRWQAAHGQSGSARMRHVRALERENRELKRLLAKALLTSARLCAMLERPEGREPEKDN